MRTSRDAVMTLDDFCAETGRHVMRWTRDAVMTVAALASDGKHDAIAKPSERRPTASGEHRGCGPFIRLMAARLRLSSRENEISCLVAVPSVESHK